MVDFYCQALTSNKIQTLSGLSTVMGIATSRHRGKTVTKPLALSRLGLPLSEKQIPQVVENLESGGKPEEALERVAMRPRKVRYQAALRPDCAAL